MVDLQSHTVTTPGPGGRRNEVEALVRGDDYGKAPTVPGEPGPRPGPNGFVTATHALSVVLAGEAAWAHRVATQLQARLCALSLLLSRAHGLQVWEKRGFSGPHRTC